MQKTELKRTSGRIVACAVLAISGAAFAGSALAATGSPSAASAQASVSTADSGQRAQKKSAQRRDHHKRGHRHGTHGMRDAAMLIPGYGPVPKDVVESLDLNPEQTSLLDDAKSFMTEHREVRRERFKKAKADQTAPKAAASLDPHAAVSKQNERFEAMHAVRTEGTQKWLALWDSLESGQQQTLSEHVANRAEQRAQRRAEHKEKRTAKAKNNR